MQNNDTIKLSNFTIDKYRDFQPIRNSINGDIVNVIVIKY